MGADSGQGILLCVMNFFQSVIKTDYSYNHPFGTLKTYRKRCSAGHGEFFGEVPERFRVNLIEYPCTA